MHNTISLKRKTVSQKYVARNSDTIIFAFEKKRNHTRNFLIALKWMVLDLFMSTVENFSKSWEETNSKWYGFQHKKCGQESIMEICNLMMEKLVKWRKSRSERCDFTKKLVKWKKSRSVRCDLTKKNVVRKWKYATSWDVVCPRS